MSNDQPEVCKRHQIFQIQPILGHVLRLFSRRACSIFYCLRRVRLWILNSWISPHLLSAYPPRVCPFLHKYLNDRSRWLQINEWYLFIILAQPNTDIVELRDGIRRFEIFYIRAAVFLPYRHLCLLESFAAHRPLAVICFCQKSRKKQLMDRKQLPFWLKFRACASVAALEKPEPKWRPVFASVFAVYHPPPQKAKSR